MNKFKKMAICFLTIIILVLIIILFVFSGFEEEQTEEELSKEKFLSEMEYVEDSILTITENYISDDYRIDGVIDWDTVKREFYVISNSSSIIILDLTNLQIDNSKVLEFGTRVNTVNSMIEGENEVAFLESLKDLYKLIPEYIEKIYSDNRSLYLEKSVKAYLLESLYYCEINDFETGLNLLESAENMYQELMNDTEYLSENSYNVNKVYISIQEMKIAIQDQSIENVIAKYLEI